MKRIDELTPIQEAAMPTWRDKWIEIGLRVGETDWDTFDKYMPVCFKKANIPYPKNIVRVSSPLVGGLAAAIAESKWKKIRKGNGAVDGAVGGAVGGAVDGAVRGAVDGAVGGAVRDAVRGAVDGAVDGAKLGWHYWLGGQFWVGGWWYGSPAYVSFFTDVCNLKLDKDIMERATANRKVCESVNYIWPNKNFVIVCARPVYIGRDANGRLHSEERKAIEYPDGWGLHYLHGVRFEEELWRKVINKTLDFKSVMEIKDIDQRWVAMKLMEPDNLLSGADAKLLNESGRGNRLYLVSNLFPSHQEAYFSYYKCPSTGRIYFSGIDPEIGKEKDADLAVAWKHHMAKEEYLTLTPLVTES